MPTWGGTATRCPMRMSRPTSWTKMRGKNGIPHDDPDDPPRRRAHTRRGPGTAANHRPPTASELGPDGALGTRAAYSLALLRQSRAFKLYWCRPTAIAVNGFLPHSRTSLMVTRALTTPPTVPNQGRPHAGYTVVLPAVARPVRSRL